MRNWLKNEYVVLTGASGGIGRELCKILICKYGAKVIGIGRNEEKMRSLKAELGERGENFTYELFNVGEQCAWDNFAVKLQENGVILRLLINNAGEFPTFAKAVDNAPEIAERVMRTNYLSIVYATHAIAPILTGTKKDKPAIVNVASSAALCTVSGTSAYSASKAAVKGFTEALQMEEKGRMYIGAIYPGTTATGLFDRDENTKNSALDIVAMPAERMAKKIARKILKKKKRAVVGWDAKCMSIVARIAPVKGLSLIRFVMKASGSKVFKNVFPKEK